MEELLKESLKEYKAKLELSKKTCVSLWKDGKSWEEEAKKAAGYKIMVESIEAELIKWIEK